MNLKNLAKRACLDAAKIHLSYFNTGIRANTKSSDIDKVTIADIESEKHIVSLLKKYTPDYNFLGEENEYEKTQSPYTWIIDPLDGTNNFAHNIPIFSVSIALAHKDDIVLGAVYDPTRDEFFFAEVKKGATLNDKRIQVTQTTKFEDSIFATGFAYDRGEAMLKNTEIISRFLKNQCMGIRRLGSAALDLCYVACGRFDGFWELSLNPWDYTAASLIVKEANGLVTDDKGALLKIKENYVVASNSHLHNRILNLIK